MSVNTTLLNAVGILEDNDALRHNLELYLNSTKDYFVSFSEDGLESLLAKQIDCQPDYILLDIHLKETNSLSQIGDIKKKFPNTSIIIMTGDRNEQLILKAFQNGAKGYLNKPFTLPETVNTMKSLQSNGSYMSPDTATKLINLITLGDSSQSADLQTTFNLTERENEIILLLKDGLSYKAIADKLFISYHTVNHHIKNLYLKMDVNSRTELVSKHLMANK